MRILPVPWRIWSSSKRGDLAAHFRAVGAVAGDLGDGVLEEIILPAADERGFGGTTNAGAEQVAQRAQAVTEQILGNNGTVQTVRASIPAGAGPRFMRLRVVK